MKEYKILRAIGSSRHNYESVRRWIDEGLLSPQGTQVLEQVDNFYTVDDEAKSVDWDIVSDRLLRRVEQVPKHKRVFQDYLATLLDLTDISEVNVVKEVKDALLTKHKLAMVDAAIAQDEDAVNKAIESYLEVRDHDDLNLEVEEVYSGLSVKELTSFFDDSNRISVGPKLLSEKIGGGLRRGHHLLLCARPEVGKSMFALNMAGTIVRQGFKVLYVGNEDPIPDLMMRAISNLSGMTEQQVRTNPEQAEELAETNGYGLITFVGMAPGTIEGISAVARSVEPDVIIIDQLRNLSASTENNTQRLDVVARGARDLGRKHSCAVISVTQAGDSAEGQLRLNMGDVDGSNTGIPGACDVMVMVGCNEEYYGMNWRMLTLPKNKIGRYHGSFAVRVEPSLSRVHSDAPPPTPKVEDGQGVPF